MGYPSTVDSGYAPKTGLAQTSGGTQQYGIPGMATVGQGTLAMSANQAFYTFMPMPYQHTLTAWELSVTTGPASAANIRVGIYLADANCQPTGAPIYDSGAVSVAQSFTGLKSATGLSLTLNPGMYVVIVNMDVAMTLQVVFTGSPFVIAALNNTPTIKNVTVAQTFGAFPNPGTQWSAANGSSGGQSNVVVWQWAE